MSEKYKRTNKQPSAHSFRSASGKIRFTLTNDYMFKIIFQKNDILSGFLCALLGLRQEEIRSLEVTNPILPGSNPTEKTFILDINISLNDSAIIDIELQVANLGNWPDRSLSYLGRSFSLLFRGKDYNSAKQALHIGILDFTLFPEYPEFYAAYRLMNVKNHQIYNDKFRLNVLELNQIHLATEEDRERGLDKWAELFKATTWEDIKMLAAYNTSFDSIAQELYIANADERIRQECEAREDFYFEQRRQQERIEEFKAEQRRQKERWEEKLRKAKTERRRQQEKLKEARAEQRRQCREITGLKRDNSAKDQVISSQGERIASQSETISSQAAEIARLREELAKMKSNG